MKINTITLLGALASANAGVIRGNAAAKKLAIMQKLTEAVNKKSSGAIRRHRQLAEEEQDYNANYDYQGFTQDTVLTPGVCVTVSKTSAYGSTVSVPYMTYTTDAGVTYAATLSAYLSGIGASWVGEKEGMCEECNTYQSYCEMDDKEKEEMAEMFADMDEQEFENYVDSAYIAFSANYGGRKLNGGFTDAAYVCDSCEQSSCSHDEEEYYKELEEMFENGVCVQLGEYLYAGPTCGADGQTIEMGVFSDQYCTSMVKDSAYGYMQNVDMGGYYMNTLLDLYTQPFSCSMGMQMDYNGNADPSEACEELFEYSISENQCSNGNQYNQYNNNEAAEEGNENEWANQNIAADCAQIFEQQDLLLNGSFMNAFTGKSYFDEGISSATIAGIAIIVIAVIGAGVALVLKSKKKKSELQEPVLYGQGGSIS